MEGPLTFDIEADEIEIFLQDVNEHLQVMEAGILRLEKDAGKGKLTDAETINAVFRAAHTLKATAAAVGHYEMSELTHTVETLFDRMRESRFSLTVAAADELLTVVDVLRTLRDEVVSRQPGDVQVAAIIFRLHELINAGAPAPAARPATRAEAESMAGRLLTPEQAALAQDYVQREYALLEINVVAGENVFAPAARLLQAALAMADAGHVIAQHPSQDDLVNDQHAGRLWLILATSMESDSVEAELRDITDLAGCQLWPYTVSATPLPPDADGEYAPAVSTIQGEDKTVRISVERLDSLMNLMGELVTDRTRMAQIGNTLRAQHGKGGAVGTLDEATAHFGRVVDQLQAEVMQARMLPIAQLFHKFPRLVRDAARATGKQVNLVMRGESTELDRSIIEAIGDPLIHLLRNAVGHGIELPQERAEAGKPPTGTVWLTAAHEEGHIVVSVQDDGRGIDPARIRQAAVQRDLISESLAAQLDDDTALALIFQPNLSTVEQVNETSGRGVGLDVVQTNVKRLNGSVTVDSEVGRGTTFRVTLPLTLAIVQAMLVNLGNDVYAVPLASIIETTYVSSARVSSIKGSPVMRWRNQVLPLLYLRQVFAHPGLAALAKGAKQAIMTVAWDKLRAGLVVDQLIGQQEIVVKSLSPLLGSVPGLSGCTILGDGRIALIVDVPSLINMALQSRQQKVQSRGDV